MSIIAYALNLIDLSCTLWALHYGVMEMNPLMQSVTMMLWYKGAVVPLLALWLNERGTKEARRGLRICAGVYGAVCVWHAVGLWVITK